ncbi:MAG: hypothetical protein IJ272_08000 [Clostridia bacterium]|nr:hypothetical protein [Clostridia bacterium]
MKKIYIILTQSGTLFSKTIRFFTGKPYNHASIGLNESLDEFYSFGRKIPTNPFIAGFVTEHKDTGVFEIFKKSPSVVIELPVTNEQYESISNMINNFKINKDDYKYDLINVAFFYSRYRLKRINRFFCSQFVAYVLNSAGISTPKPPEQIQAVDFLKLKKANVIYKGHIQNYNKKTIQ